ncbi:MAG TPA: beta-glucosidase BglX [Cyclobacteriaceae bacterium]|nr:beta-glucosidase BglX [Cyclobacteriaceae bacterium]
MKPLYFFLTILVVSGCNKSSHQNNDDARIDSLISVMTLEEKIGQLSLYTSDWDVTGPTMRAGYKEDIRKGRVGAIFNAFTAKYTRELQEMAVKETRLHIPLLFGYDVIHGHRTIFPIPLGTAASWDMPAIENAERIAAEEASAEGLHWTFAPMVDIARDPRWGRIMEGSGEDTYLGSRIAEARVKGFQGKGIGQLNSVMACVKHFAAYGASQAGRDYHMVDMSNRVFRETYLPPYVAAINAGSATVMSSFNEYDGLPASGSRFLLTELLRNELKFDGFTVSDYTSIMEMLAHGVVADTASAAALALNAGLDMDMQAGFYQSALPGLVKDGVVKEETIDQSVRRILKKKFELGLFDDPYRFSDTARERSTVMKPEFLQAAREMSRKSIVLLKNGQTTTHPILPLAKNIGTIAVVGPLAHARREMIGAWSAAGDWKKSVTLLEGIQNVSPATNIIYAPGCNIDDDSTKYFSDAMNAARRADAVVLAVGEGAWMSGEAASRASLGLPGVQQKLVEEIVKTGKPVVVVLMNGRPLTIGWIDKNATAVVETWFLGTQAGNAIADVLFGDYNPSGKLPVTFPKSVGQIPIFYNVKNTGRPMDKNNKYTSKYLDEENEPLYPFGFGLSYTSFEYGNVKVSKPIVAKDESFTVSCTLKNTGIRDGEEVVQLYIRDMVGSVTRPVRELKDFQKVMLKAGESKEITFTIEPSDLFFFRQDMSYGLEPGKFKVFVGGNSRDTKEGEFSVK